MPDSERTDGWRPSSPEQPAWLRVSGLLAIAVGLLAAAGALFFDVLFVVKHSSAPGLYDSAYLLPNALLIPSSTVLLWFGGLALIAGRRRLLVLAAVLVWAVASCYGPGLFTDMSTVRPIL
jgi:hypothetical protein